MAWEADRRYRGVDGDRLRSGPGWQARITAILMEVVRREAAAAEPAETEA